MTFGRATSPVPLERRASPRSPISCPARLRTCFGDIVGSLSDLSISGARFHAPSPPKEGTTALLEWESHDAICRIVWAKADGCGLIFERPIARHIVEKSTPPQGSTEPPANLGKIAVGQRSSLRAVLVGRAGNDDSGA